MALPLIGGDAPQFEHEHETKFNVPGRSLKWRTRKSKQSSKFMPERCLITVGKLVRRQLHRPPTRAAEPTRRVSPRADR